LDFVVYESLQKFNQHQDILRVLAVVSRVYHRFYGGPFDGRDSSLMQWLVQNAIEGSAIVEFARQNSEAIKQEAETEDAKYDIELMSMIYAVLDIMEGYSKDARDLKQSIEDALMSGDKKSLGLRIDDCFKGVAPGAILQSTVIDTKRGRDSQYGEVFFDVKDLLGDEKVSVWSRFALGRRV